MTVEKAKQVVDSEEQGGSLNDQRSIVVVLLGFSRFLRVSELLTIQVKHFRAFSDIHFEITIPKRGR